ncbi:MAG: hypothetical protein NT155_00375 [Candidatus Staskawiczbacteria bacterium]|nr:hypothetical protein [Candidatus Staskawiczbacteria bacterium]
MKATRVLAIVGIILSSLALLVACGDGSGRIEDFVGWLLIMSAYSLAFSIVATVQTRSK